MGNRAVIAFAGQARSKPALYLHWNGGLASVTAFLDVAKTMHLPATHKGLRELGEIIRHKFFDGTSVFFDPLDRSDCDNGDNGLYRIDHKWTIVGRVHQPSNEEMNPEKTRAITRSILGSIEYFSWFGK